MRHSTLSQRFARLFAMIGFACLSAYAMAQENESGPYIGAGAGQFDIELETLVGVNDFLGKLDADDTAWKMYFGWRFNPVFALEADYIDLGAPQGNFAAPAGSGNYELDVSGYAAYVVGTVPLGSFEISGKVGYYFHDLTVDVDSASGTLGHSEQSDEAWTYALGGGVTLLEHLTAKLEYELIDLRIAEDAYALWLTGEWRF